VGYEYDPHNKLRHTTYWFETDGTYLFPPFPSLQPTVLSSSALTVQFTSLIHNHTLSGRDRDLADQAEKAEWPLSQNANFEAPPQPSAPFDYNAVPSTFYFDIEASGSVPVREVVTQGLDILAMNLAKVIEGVEIETGGRDEDDVAEGGGLVEPNAGGGEYYGGVGGGGDGYYGGGGGGNGMSPLRR